MAGAMAGSAVLKLGGRSNHLRVVTLTVNNVCNLQCPHCYLQYDLENHFVDQSIVDALCKADFSHLAIVGKEPLFNGESAQRCGKLINKFLEHRKTVSIITNGHGLHHLNPEILESLAWIDVSLDGGPKSYASYRRASYEHVISKLDSLKKQNYRRVNALFALSEQNFKNLNDMVLAERDFPFERLIFSPYVVTSNQGQNSVFPISFEALCHALSRSTSFMESTKTMFLFGTHAFPGKDLPRMKDVLNETKISDKTFVIEEDPLNLGILRVTFDGLVLTPYESLHTSNYKTRGRQLIDGQHLNQLYHDLCVTRCA